jgi:hypothetical protein
MNNTTSNGDDEGDEDMKKKRLNKFLDDKELECEKCIEKLKRNNKKKNYTLFFIDIICCRAESEEIFQYWKYK